MKSHLVEELEEAFAGVGLFVLDGFRFVGGFLSGGPLAATGRRLFLLNGRCGIKRFGQWTSGFVGAGENFDFLFRFLECPVTVAEQRDALLEPLHRFVEADLSRFEIVNDLL